MNVTSGTVSRRAFGRHRVMNNPLKWPDFALTIHSGSKNAGFFGGGGRHRGSGSTGYAPSNREVEARAVGTCEQEDVRVVEGPAARGAGAAGEVVGEACGERGRAGCGAPRRA